MKQKLLTLAIACLSFTNVCQAAFPIQATEVTVPATETQTTLNSAEMSSYSSAPIIRKLSPAKVKEKGVGSPIFGILSIAFIGLAWLLAAASESFGIFLAFSIIALVLGAMGLSKRLKGLAIAGFILGLLTTILAVLVVAGI